MHCFPLPISTGGKGEPVATSALPSVHFIASSGSTSHRTVGFDIGKMMGRSTCFAISRMISSLNARECVDVPISTVGFTAFTTAQLHQLQPSSHFAEL